jgi:rhodanese-related sulfurtransferase
LTAGVPQMNMERYMQEYHQQNNHLLIDVRTVAEFKSGHMEKAKNIPLNTIAKKINSIPKDKTVVLVCRTGSRSGMAARQLANAGYENVINL